MTLLLLACTGTIDDSSVTTEPREDFSACDASAGDDKEVVSASTDGRYLIVGFAYGGGCEDHDFVLCWDGEFSEDTPASIQVSFFHDANGDTCDMFVKNDERNWDLTPVREAYEDAFDVDSGTVIVEVEGLSGGREYSWDKGDP